MTSGWGPQCCGLIFYLFLIFNSRVCTKKKDYGFDSAAEIFHCFVTPASSFIQNKPPSTRWVPMMCYLKVASSRSERQVFLSPTQYCSQASSAPGRMVFRKGETDTATPCISGDSDVLLTELLRVSQSTSTVEQSYIDCEIWSNLQTAVLLSRWEITCHTKL